MLLEAGFRDISDVWDKGISQALYIIWVCNVNIVRDWHRAWSKCIKILTNSLFFHIYVSLRNYSLWRTRLLPGNRTIAVSFAATSGKLYCNR